MKVFVLMSGGVDSSTAAAILKEQGYEVVGVTLQIWPKEKARDADKFGGCCGLSAVEDARQVCNVLGIPHYVMNFRQVFKQEVIDYFARSYLWGLTPNPCLICNKIIKFEIFLKKARALGADYIATGHYARIEQFAVRSSETDIGMSTNTEHRTPNTERASQTCTRYALKKGVDKRKDQSYFLYAMTQEQLAQTLMPLGHLRKSEVRQVAKEMGLPVAEKEESQEICFIPDNNYRKFLTHYLSTEKGTVLSIKPGPILDREGSVLGTHNGIINYTIGQRKGLRIASSKSLYVLAIDAWKKAVIVGEEAEIYQRSLVGTNARWIEGKPDGAIRLKARIRYNMKDAQAMVRPLTNGKVEVKFDQPQWAITPGQAVVFYQNDLVVGGATIEGTR